MAAVSVTVCFFFTATTAAAAATTTTTSIAVSQLVLFGCVSVVGSEPVGIFQALLCSSNCFSSIVLYMGGQSSKGGMTAELIGKAREHYPCIDWAQTPKPYAPSRHFSAMPLED